MDMRIDETRQQGLVAAIDDGRIRGNPSRESRQDLLNSVSFNDDRPVWKRGIARPVNDRCILQNQCVHLLSPPRLIMSLYAMV
jgi:hypothetical protein